MPFNPGWLLYQRQLINSFKYHSMWKVRYGGVGGCINNISAAELSSYIKVWSECMNPRRNENISEKNGLTHKQHQAVAELLKPNHKSYEDVANALGISSRCLYNWGTFKWQKCNDGFCKTFNRIKARGTWINRLLMYKAYNIFFSCLGPLHF